MTTGYTQKIKEGVGFRDFVLNCATAFAYDCTELKEEEPNDYHKIELQKARKGLTKVQKISLVLAKKKTEKQYQKDKKYYEESNQKDDRLQVKYEKMLKQVEGWQPPTSEHQALKNFMIEQIESSIKFDCGHSYDKPIKKTPEGWIKAKIRGYKGDIKYHSEEWDKELEGNKSNNDWLKELKNSLPFPKEKRGG